MGAAMGAARNVSAFFVSVFIGDDPPKGGFVKGAGAAK
jgi:hypothetical protein